MIPRLEYGISCPPEWVRLPVDPSEDARSWAKDTAAELGERSGAAGFGLDRKALRRDLRARVEDSRNRDPLYAFALYPEGFDAALATLEVDLIHPDAEVSEITLDWLADVFSAHDFGPPEVAFTDLLIGPAVRIRQNFAAADPPLGGPGIFLETLTYGILPKGTVSALMLLVSWTVPGVAEALVNAADGIAKTLTVDF